MEDKTYEQRKKEDLELAKRLNRQASEIWKLSREERRKIFAEAFALSIRLSGYKDDELKAKEQKG